MRLVTINLRHDVDRWKKRQPLLLDELTRLEPDVVALQEVALGVRQADVIAEHLNATFPSAPFSVHVEPKHHPDPIEGIGIVSRLPVVQYEGLPLPGDGGRVAQIAHIDTPDGQIALGNTHLHNYPIYDEVIRLGQVKALLGRVAQDSGAKWLLAGDFNAIPTTETIQAVYARFDSAYALVHGGEPSRTYPTPLVRDQHRDHEFDRAIDYVFLRSADFEVADARIAFDNAAPNDPTLYPSDHYGLVVAVRLRQSS